MKTSKHSPQQQSLPLNFGAQDGHAKTSAMQNLAETASTERRAACTTTFFDLLAKFTQRGLSWRTSRASYRQSKEPLLRQLPTRWKRLGIWGGGSRATFEMRAFPRTGIECSLSQLIDQDVPITSLLTAANCRGILRREERAGRLEKLDPQFHEALKETLRLWFNVAEASGTPKQVACAPRYVPKPGNIKAAIQTDRYSVARNLTWTECERLMGFPEGWTVVEGDS